MTQKIFDKNEIIKKFKELKTYAEISREYGVSKSRIYKIVSSKLKKADIDLVKHKRSVYKKNKRILEQKNRYKTDTLYREKLKQDALQRYRNK